MNTEDATAFFANTKGKPLFVVLSSAQAVREFRECLHRALNTWESSPAWLVDIADLIDKEDGKPVPSPADRRV